MVTCVVPDILLALGKLNEIGPLRKSINLTRVWRNIKDKLLYILIIIINVV